MDWNLILHLLVPVALALAVNGIVFGLKWNSGSPGAPQSKLLPPGVVIAIIWVALLAMIGFARWLVVTGTATKFTAYASWLLVALVAYCLAYPFITQGMKRNTKIVNTGALILAFATSCVTLGSSTKAALFLVPLLLWVSYVCLVDASMCDAVTRKP